MPLKQQLFLFEPPYPVVVALVARDRSSNHADGSSSVPPPAAAALLLAPSILRPAFLSGALASLLKPD